MHMFVDARVLTIATNGFAELAEPRQALIDAGVVVDLASPSLDTIRGVAGTDLSNMSPHFVSPDLVLEDVNVEHYDALFIPGGLANPDTLRTIPSAVAVVRAFIAAGKLVASICHGPWMLIEADAVKGKAATGWHSLRTDLTNAGARVWDEPVVKDDNLLTSRMPEDIPFFSEALVQALRQQCSVRKVRKVMSDGA
ncbi:type 1 glutamine amidotransferase domain-containing protein [Neorhizobium sp. NPDC001467]|uniref:type 1 glutamine amidotransferase domain-containing protein n=1 Tax=Neorhizobium sp. NPDC001467 TaxID=3390595 RepID=UPI003CFF76ED